MKLFQSKVYNPSNLSRINLSVSASWSLLALLVLLLLATRSHHFVTLHDLPGASYAVFLLGGFYLQRSATFLFLIAIAFAIDLISVTFGGVDNFCVSPAYPFLLPAYGLLWFSGLLAAKYYEKHVTFLAIVSLATLLGLATCELIASGSFYFFSGRFPDLGINEFINRLFMYYPSSLQAVAFYVLAAAVLHYLFIQLSKIKNKTNLRT